MAKFQANSIVSRNEFAQHSPNFNAIRGRNLFISLCLGSLASSRRKLSNAFRSLGGKIVRSARTDGPTDRAMNEDLCFGRETIKRISRVSVPVIVFVVPYHAKC